METNVPSGRIENPVCLQQEITAYMHWSLPLCFILAYEKYRGWFDEQFIQIYTHSFDNPGFDSNYLWVDFYEFTPALYYTPVLFSHYTLLGYEESRSLNIIDYTTKKVDAGYYIVIHLDEYYIPDKRAHQNRHFVHPSLVYGYDLSGAKILTIGLNRENILSKTEIDFEDFSNSFRSGEHYYKNDASYAENYIIQLFLPTDARGLGFPYRLNPKKVLDELKKYLRSEGDGNKIIRLGETHFGLSVYDEVIHNLELRLHDRHTIDYRAIHLLFEHKRGIFARLQHIQALFEQSRTLHELVDQYQPLVPEMDQVRMAYLRSALIASKFQSFFKLPADSDIVNQITSALGKVKVREEAILTAFCEELEALL